MYTIIDKAIALEFRQPSRVFSKMQEEIAINTTRLEFSKL